MRCTICVLRYVLAVVIGCFMPECLRPVEFTPTVRQHELEHNS